MAVSRMRYADVSARAFSSMCLLCGIRYESPRPNAVFTPKLRRDRERRPLARAKLNVCRSSYTSLAFLFDLNAITELLTPHFLSRTLP